MVWNKFHQVLHKMRHRNQHKSRKSRCQTLFFSYFSLEHDSNINLIRVLDWFWMLCHHWTSRFNGIFKQLIVCWEELLGFLFFFDIIAFCISSTNFWRGCCLLLSSQDGLMNLKQQSIMWTIDGKNIAIKWVVMIMLLMVIYMLLEN